MTSVWLKKGIKGYEDTVFPITFYTLFNLDTCDSWKCFTEEFSRIITFDIMFHVKHDSIHFI